MIQISRSVTRVLPRAVAVAGLVFLTACAAPSERFYSLASDAPAMPASNSATPAWRVDVRPVKVPAAVSRSQLVVQIDAAEVKVLEDDRWASPLADEIRAVLVADLSGQAGTAGRDASVKGPDVPVYQITAEVQRFESWPRSHVLIDAVWTVRTPDGTGARTCHSVRSEPVSGGYQAIVDGHRRAIAIIAAQIAQVVRALAADAADSPSRSAGGARRSTPREFSCAGVADSMEAGLADRQAAAQALPQVVE